MDEEFIDEVKSLQLFLKYVLGTKNVESHILLDAMLRMEKIGKVFIERGYPENSLDEYIDMDDIKEITFKFIDRLATEALR